MLNYLPNLALQNTIRHILGCLLSTICWLQMTAQVSLDQPGKLSLIFFDDRGLELVEQKIKTADKYYIEALREVIIKADDYLHFDADPVVNKSGFPPSGDKHDYLSIAPYWWPDTTTRDGLPWIRRDGEVNPQTRGNHTDKLRLANMFNAITHLSWAYLYSQDQKYADKAIDILNIWFVDEATRVNPNVQFGQGVPGRSDGRPFGIIEWRGIADVVTAFQIFEHRGLLTENTRASFTSWISSYTDWLLLSDLGREEGSRSNNHASWYDYQAIGLLLYLGRDDEARSQAEAAKVTRISLQIRPDGSQPKELKRTRSLSYSTMNLKALVLVGHLAKSVDVDLLDYVALNGASLRQAVNFLSPFATDQQAWAHQQIGKRPDLISFFSLISTVFGEPLLPPPISLHDNLPPLQRLRYPPHLFLAD